MDNLGFFGASNAAAGSGAGSASSSSAAAGSGEAGIAAAASSSSSSSAGQSEVLARLREAAKSSLQEAKIRRLQRPQLTLDSRSQGSSFEKFYDLSHGGANHTLLQLLGQKDVTYLSATNTFINKLVKEDIKVEGKWGQDFTTSVKLEEVRYWKERFPLAQSLTIFWEAKKDQEVIRITENEDAGIFNEDDDAKVYIRDLFETLANVLSESPNLKSLSLHLSYDFRLLPDEDDTLKIRGSLYPILDALQNLVHLETLDLSGCHLLPSEDEELEGQECGLDRVASALEKMPRLQHLLLKKCWAMDEDEQDCSDLFIAIRKHCRELKTLDVSFNYLGRELLQIFNEGPSAFYEGGGGVSKLETLCIEDSKSFFENLEGVNRDCGKKNFINLFACLGRNCSETFKHLHAKNSNLDVIIDRFENEDLVSLKYSSLRLQNVELLDLGKDYMEEHFLGAGQLAPFISEFVSNFKKLRLLNLLQFGGIVNDANHETAMRKLLTSCTNLEVLKIPFGFGEREVLRLSECFKNLKMLRKLTLVFTGHDNGYVEDDLCDMTSDGFAFVILNLPDSLQYLEIRFLENSFNEDDKTMPSAYTQQALAKLHQLEGKGMLHESLKEQVDKLEQHYKDTREKMKNRREIVSSLFQPGRGGGDLFEGGKKLSAKKSKSKHSKRRKSKSSRSRKSSKLSTRLLSRK